MKQIRVLIADDKENCRAALRNILQPEKDIVVTGEASDGMEALRMLNRKPADVLLLDAVMPCLDGFGVVQQLRQLPARSRPRVILLTSSPDEDFMLRASRMGVTSCLSKPVGRTDLLALIRDSGKSMFCSGQPFAYSRPEISSPDHMLRMLCLSLGIPAHSMGYPFLRDAIRIVLEKPDYLNGITKKLYPEIACRFSTSPSRVERDIRHAIEVGWSRGRVDALNRAFGCQVVTQEEKPSNSEFIAMVAELLSSELERG